METTILLSQEISSWFDLSSLNLFDLFVFSGMTGVLLVSGTFVLFRNTIFNLLTR